MVILVNVLLFILPWLFVHCNDHRDKLFFLQRSSGEDSKTLLVVTWVEYGEEEITAVCEMFTDEDLINEVLGSSNGSDIRTLSENEMKSLLGDCTEFNLRRRRRESDKQLPRTLSAEDVIDDPREFWWRSKKAKTSQKETESRNTRRTNATDLNAIKRTTEAPTTATPGYDGWPVIFPGTKWCGAGDIAKSYDDLGFHQDTDRCCRAHDLCNDTLAPKETRNNLTNNSPFTKLSCKCDHDFYSCLDRANSVTSNTIGNMYFNLLKRECYQKDYPATKKCKKYRTIFKIKCVEYEKDTSKDPKYQWIPAKKYKKIPVPGPLTITLPF